ncbi:MAG: hypothetical protein KC416_11830, partial [Myxococcales bacterium]|nr:hypothetical protein [Myxococcales bacterium]
MIPPNHDVYLTEPGTRRPRTAAGERAVELRFADTSFRFEGMNEAQERHVRDRFGPLFVDRPSPDAHRTR